MSTFILEDNCIALFWFYRHVIHINIKRTSWLGYFQSKLLQYKFIIFHPTVVDKCSTSISPLVFILLIVFLVYIICFSMWYLLNANDLNWVKLLVNFIHMA
jgi:hypothetical protein